MFEYVMVLASIILGLGITHLLAGVVQLATQPKRAKVYWVHLVWVAYMFLVTIFWWWWEFKLHQIQVWTFQIYLYILFYAFLMYLLCALLFPARFEDGESFEDYYYAKRGWFFGAQMVYLVVDVGDTWLKGAAHFASLSLEYQIMSVVQISGCIIAAFTKNRRYHEIFAVTMLAYQVSWVFRYFDTMN